MLCWFRGRKLTNNSAYCFLICKQFVRGFLSYFWAQFGLFTFFLVLYWFLHRRNYSTVTGGVFCRCRCRGIEAISVSFWLVKPSERLDSAGKRTAVIKYSDYCSFQPDFASSSLNPFLQPLPCFYFSSVFLSFLFFVFFFSHYHRL